MSNVQRKMKLLPGREVMVDGKRYTIKELIDIDSLLAINTETSKTKIIKSADVILIPHGTPSEKSNLESIDSSRWEKAQHRYEAIKPLLELSRRTRQDIEKRSQEVGVAVSTLYHWLKQYQNSELLTSLVRSERKDKGQKKLPEHIEQIITEAIETEYLTTQRISVRKLSNSIKQKCIREGIEAPHYNTVLNRIEAIEQARRSRELSGSKESSTKFAPVLGHFPEADYLLSVIQIDHTKVDLILVDDYYRKSIGRPNITLAIDVFSRMVTGFYISFDPPGALSTGLCVAHSILIKDKWLQKHKTKNAWKVWGVPRKLHMDNAKEFRGVMLEQACQQYGIDIEWRPVGRPNFGGHIERLLGTFMKELHTLPGTTFSNTQERRGYNSEKKAALTLSEFETWLTTFIVDVYHQRLHTTLGMTPWEKYQEGIIGNKNTPGIGIPAQISDEDRLRLDFLPFVARTIQNYGVAIDDVHYWHDVLRSWIKAPDTKNKGSNRKFIFRRDPRDISSIWFYDPELDTYFEIPYRDTSHPPMSIWELRETKRHLKKIGRTNYDERAIFETYDRLNAIQHDAQKKTAAVRKSQQRKKYTVPIVKLADSTVMPEPTSVGKSLVAKSIEPFDDLEDLS